MFWLVFSITYRSQSNSHEEEDQEDLLYGAESGWVDALTSCDHLPSLSSDLLHIPDPNTPCLRLAILGINYYFDRTYINSRLNYSNLENFSITFKLEICFVYVSVLFNLFLFLYEKKMSST